MAAPEVAAAYDGGGGCATVTLNRPAKLNSLNLNMIRLLHGVMDEVDRRAGSLGCLVMDGAGGKAFCAGGDVAKVREQALAGGSLPHDFFYEEYAVVHRIAGLFERTGCCQVSLWDGFTMGGGVGLSLYGPFRVVTEKTQWAKPEMAIGLFPDVGSTHKLSRLDGANLQMGLYLGLIGPRLNAADCLRAGVATHYVPSARVPKLRELLARGVRAGVTGAAAKAAVEAALREAAAGAAPPPPVLITGGNIEVIDRCFAAPTLEGIVERLRAEPGEFAAGLLRTLHSSSSPTSCKVSLEAIRRLARPGATMGECLTLEYRLAQRFTTRPQPLSDFHEGIRAVLVDKDRKQKWSPGWDSLADITPERVEGFFAPLEAGHRRGELHLQDPGAWSAADRATFPPPGAFPAVVEKPPVARL